MRVFRWRYFWTSSYITIEGLTNSQCGTLFPFPRGSESMAGGSGLAERLACLGDVLAAAGYHQVYQPTLPIRRRDRQ